MPPADAPEETNGEPKVALGKKWGILKKHVKKIDEEAVADTKWMVPDQKAAALPKFADVLELTVAKNSDILDRLGAMRKARSNGSKQINRYIDKYNLS